MDARLKRPSELNAAEREGWNAFLDADPALASPYFRLEFAEACEEARGDTRVIVTRERGELIGFLPLQTGRLGYARPLAGPLGDVNGVIAADADRAEVGAWLRTAGVPLYEYHSALGSQACWRETGGAQEPSFVIDLARGYDAFEAERAAVEPKAFRNIRARRRKLDEAEGGFAFDIEAADPQAAATLMDWKSAQYRRTGVFDVFSVGWTRKLIAAILRRRSERFRGVCSTLKIGGVLAAVHVGMASERRLHYWFPAYDPEYNKVSPGLLLLLESARDVAERGLDSAELGPGDYEFKRHLGSIQIPILTGCVTTRSPAALLRGAARAMADAAERAPLGPLKTAPRRVLRKADRFAGFYAL